MQSTLMGCQKAAAVEDDSQRCSEPTEACCSRRGTVKSHIERAGGTLLRAIKALRPGKHEALCKSAELQRPTQLQRANIGTMSTREWAVVTVRKERALRQPLMGGTGRISHGGPVLPTYPVSPTVDSRRQAEAREQRKFLHRRRDIQRTQTW